MLDEIRTLVRAREAAKSFGQAVARFFDPNTGVEHHHTPPRASGSGVSAVPKPSGPDMVDASTQSEPIDALDASCIDQNAQTRQTFWSGGGTRL
eukprot:2974748-Pleurochrysis_carterae.AAC.1